MQQEKNVHPVDEILPLGKLCAYGMQHVMAMYAGCVAVPLIIANALGLSKDQLIYLINADLFTVGIATLIQAFGFLNMGSKLPVVQGVSFAAVTPMILIGKNFGIQGIFGSVIVAGLIAYLISPYFGRLIRFFPRVVTGTIITIIGISLLPVAVRWAGGGVPGTPGFGSVQNIGLSLTVLVLVTIFYRYLKGFWSNISVLLGLIVGTVIAVALGITDFSRVASAAWFGVATPFAFGMPIFDLPSILSLTLVMLVIMTETTGDIIAVGEIVGKPVKQQDLVRGLRADGFSTLLGGIMNTFPYSAFAQNVGLVSLTGVRSRFVIVSAGVILMLLGLFPKAAAVVAAIPTPVLGGAGIAMFGMVAASGIRSLAQVNFEGNGNAMIVAISLGVGLIPLAVPTFYHHFPSWAQLILHSGITVGSLLAVLLNFCFNEIGKKTVVAEQGQTENH
ncbi:MAG: xanthine permease [Anaerosporomusa subterranea]|jgi:NCS2 family nucleobase:cation symporter-2|nr:xanthine permease [Anaerosporomusa subterranea]